MSKPYPDMSQQVARFSDLVFGGNAFLDAYIPGHERYHASVIGTGVVEKADETPTIAADGFTLGYTRVPPGNGNCLHDHQTAEVFIPLSGRFKIAWGDQGEHSVMLDPMDVISIPPGVHRHYTNVSNVEGLLLSVLGGTDSGKVTWAQKVLDDARGHGYALNEKGEVVRVMG